jgi:ferric-dicitrate binding protein FerR (iron transport regulator)
MSDDQSPTTASYDDPDLEWEPDDAPALDAPPPRPRRRLLTPFSGGLAAIALAAGGFVAGVQVQKGQQDGNAAGPGAGARAEAFAARTGGGAAAGGNANATVGTVANVKGTTLYVTGTDGTTVKIRTNDDSKVTRNADSAVRSVHPGDSVVVQGTKNRSGSVTATSITATAKGVSAFDGLGGALPGATQGGTGQSGGVPQGFAPPQG